MGDGVRRGAHTQECRARIEPLLGEDRNQRAATRMNEFLAGQDTAADENETTEDDPKDDEMVEEAAVGLDVATPTPDDVDEVSLQDSK